MLVSPAPSLQAVFGDYQSVGYWVSIQAAPGLHDPKAFWLPAVCSCLVLWAPSWSQALVKTRPPGSSEVVCLQGEASFPCSIFLLKIPLLERHTWVVASNEDPKHPK
jgi:hypothetical protein